MRLPSVIRLLEYRRIPHQSRALSRKNILLRDRNTCQYCATVLSSGELTLDHVIPRSRGGSVHLGESGRLLPSLQPPQGQPVSRGSRYEADARTPRLQPPHQPPHHAPDGPVATISGGSICSTELQFQPVQEIKVGAPFEYVGCPALYLERYFCGGLRTILIRLGLIAASSRRAF